MQGHNNNIGVTGVTVKLLSTDYKYVKKLIEI